MTKQVKKLLTPMRTMAVLLVAGIFALTGFIGGVFAPIATHLMAYNGNALTSTIQVGNYQLSNLPKSKAKLSNDPIVVDDIPSVTGGADYEIEFGYTTSSKTQPFVILGKSANNTIVGQKYDRIADYEWRFYATSQDVENQRVLFYTHPVEVYQESFMFEVPASAHHAHDAKPSYIPSIVENNREIQFPLPNKFTDKKGINLFDDSAEVREDVLKGRADFIASLQTGFRVPYISDVVAFNKDNAQHVANTEYFKKLVWANTEISFPGARSNTVKINNADRVYKNEGGFIYGTTKANMANALEARTFCVSQRGTYFATYTLHFSDYTASQNTNNVSVEFVSTQKNVESEIIFKRPFSFGTTLSSNSLSFGIETTLPLPTLTTSTMADEDVSRDDLGFTPVSFTQNVANYTFIEVERSSLQEPSKFSVIATITSEDNYKFTPTEQGYYRLKYYTTTIFGTGNYAHIKNRDNQPEIAKNWNNSGVDYIVYNPHGIITINRSETAPEIKWTVPFNYGTGTNAGKATVAETSNLFDTIKDATIYDKNDKVGTFDKAPDLSHYLPALGTTSSMELSLDDKIVIPALLGHGNIASTNGGQDLQYILTLTKGTTTRTSITFDSKQAQDSNSTTRFFYDNSKPLILDLKNSKFTNGGTEVNISTWTADQANTYTLAVSVNDNSIAKDFFHAENRGRSTITQNYTFQLVTTGKDILDPQFNGSISVDKSAYYLDETLSWSEIHATDKTTPNVKVDYFIIWGDNQPANFVKLGKDFIKNGKVSIDLDDKTTEGDKLIQALGTEGLLSMRVVAIAQNYQALMGGVNNNFVAGAISRDFITKLIADKNKAQVDREAKYNGMAVTTIDVKLYDHTFGKPATIETTADSDWTDFFETQNTNKGALQHQPVTMPMVSVSYDEVNPVEDRKTISTTIEISMHTSKGMSNTGLTGNRFVQTSLTEDGDKFDITNLNFTPDQIGIHTFVVTAKNTGNYVSVFTGTINVKGSPVISPVLNDDGTSTLKIGQSGRLPSVLAAIEGDMYVTDGNKNIMLRDSSPAVYIGEYHIVGNIENTSITGSINNTFIPYVEGTYTFTYYMTFYKDGYKNGFDGLSILADNEVKREISTTINVTGLEDGDLKVGIVDADFRGVNNIVGKDFARPTGGDLKVDYKNISGTVEEWNVIPEMATTSASSFTFNKLDESMFEVTAATDDKDAVYEFGPIFLPTMRAEWAAGLNIPNYSKTTPYGFNLAEDSYVTVKHSKTTDFIFDSRKIEASSNPERRVARIDVNGRDKDFYYFQPVGQVNVSKSDVDNDNISYGRNINKLVDRNSAPDGIYTVTYTITYGGITATTSFDIAVGDTHSPIITLDEDMQEKHFNKNYGINSTFKLDSDWVKVNANSGWLTPQQNGEFANWYVAKNLNVSVQRPGSSGHLSNDEIKQTPSNNNDIRQWKKGETDAEMAQTNFDAASGYLVGEFAEGGTFYGRTWDFKLEQSGEYRITLSITSESGMTDVKTYVITVDPEKAKTKISPQTIWGTILIVISSGLLLGVIVYFIQTGRKTRFAGNTAKTAKAKAKKDEPATTDAPEITE